MRYSGRTWAYWSFRVNSISLEREIEKLILGLKRITAFWAIKNGKELRDIEFKVKGKWVPIQIKWKKGTYKNHAEKPWEDIGIIRWKENKFAIDLKDIKKLKG